jgi:hypothetical protein
LGKIIKDEISYFVFYYAFSQVSLNCQRNSVRVPCPINSQNTNEFDSLTLQIHNTYLIIKSTRKHKIVVLERIYDSSESIN